jgi:hypothetical protein
MITYRNKEEIDPEKWEELVGDSPSASVFASTWYLNAVCDNWGALIVDDFKAALPLAIGRKMGINYIFQPFFTRYSPVLHNNLSYKVSTEEILAAIPEKFRLIDFSLDEVSDYSGSKFQVEEKKFQVLDLNMAYPEIKSNYSENTLRNIKKAEKIGLHIGNEVSPEELIELFRNTKGKQLKIFSKKDYLVLLKLMKACLTKNRGEILGVFEGGELVGAGFFIFSSNRIIYLKGGVTDRGKKIGAMHLLFDHLIKTNASKYAILDFGGSSIDSVARFYRSFGGKDCIYLHLTYNSLPGLIKWLGSKK